MGETGHRASSCPQCADTGVCSTWPHMEHIGNPDRSYCTGYGNCVFPSHGRNSDVRQAYTLTGITTHGGETISLAFPLTALLVSAGTQYDGTNYLTGGNHGDWTGFFRNADVYATTSAPTNNYTVNTGVMHDYKVCNKVGYKNVFARRFWHGDIGFLLGDRTKFCQLVISGTASFLHKIYSDGATDNVATLLASMDQTLTVGKLTGVTVVSGSGTASSYAVDGYGGSGPQPGNLLDHLGLSEPTLVDVVAFLLSNKGNYADSTFLTDLATTCKVGLTGGGYTIGPSFTTLTNTSLVLTSEYVLGTEVAHPATMDYRRIKFDVSLTFSDATEDSDIESDLNMLLGYWDLNDDIEYPWRYSTYPSADADESTKCAPLMMRKELQLNVPLPSQTVSVDSQGSDGVWVVHQVPGGDKPDDPAALICDGSIIGAPNPVDYPDNYFDPYAGVWNYIALSDSWRLDEVGGFLSSVLFGLPPRTTHWVDYWDQQNKCRGQWIRYNVNSTADNPLLPLSNYDSGVIKSKWAETKIHLPSEDFSRPNGADRLAIDQTTVGVPNCTPPNDLGTLRWPHCPAFGWRKRVDAVTDIAGVTHLTLLDAAVYLGTTGNEGDRITICDSSMTAIYHGAYLVTNSSTDFSLYSDAGLTTQIAAASLAGAVYIVVYGALTGEGPITDGDGRTILPWYFGNTNGRGGYVVCDWTRNFDPLVTTLNGYSAFSASNHCAKWTTLSPWRIVLSPNAADTPTAGTGERISLDGVPLSIKLGTHRIVDVMQAAISPFYQATNKVCDGGIPSACLALVEFYTDIPGATGAPTGWGAAQNETTTLPTGCQFGVVNPVTVAGPTPGLTIDPSASIATGIELWSIAPNGIYGGC